MLENEFIGKGVRSDFRLFLVNGGRTWINYSYGVYTFVLHYDWILDPVNKCGDYTLRIGKGRPRFGQPVCVSLFFISSLPAD